MWDNYLIELLKVVSSLLTAVFGAFAIGTDTRDKRGSLTKYGRIAFVGLFISFLLSILFQTVEYRKNINAKKAEPARLERVIQSGFYGTLSTDNAIFDLRFDIDIQKIKYIDPLYIERLNHAFNYFKSCALIEENVAQKKYECDSYFGTVDFLDFETIFFNHGSTVLPDPSKETASSVLIEGLGISLTIGEFRYSGLSNKPININLSDYPDEIKYSYDGRRLTAQVENVKLPDDFLVNHNLSSLVDLVGLEVTL